MPDEYVIVLTTLPADTDAVAVARTLVTDRLAACINLFGEMTSVYRWEGELSQDAERQIVIKTTRARVDALWERLRDLHPYDMPEFIVLTVVDGSDAYLRWIGDSTA